MSELEVPLERFDNEEAVAAKVQKIIARIEAVLKEEIGEYPKNSNVVFGLNLIWDIALKQGDKYVDSTYAISSRPHTNRDLYRLVHELLAKDAALVQEFIHLFSNKFFDLFLLASASTETLNRIRHANHEHDESCEIQPDNTGTDDKVPVAPEKPMTAAEKAKLDKRHGMHLVKNTEDEVN